MKDSERPKDEDGGKGHLVRMVGGNRLSASEVSATACYDFKIHR